MCLERFTSLLTVGGFQRPLDQAGTDERATVRISHCCQRTPVWLCGGWSQWHSALFARLHWTPGCGSGEVSVTLGIFIVPLWTSVVTVCWLVDSCLQSFFYRRQLYRKRSQITSKSIFITLGWVPFQWLIKCHVHPQLFICLQRTGSVSLAYYLHLKVLGRVKLTQVQSFHSQLFTCLKTTAMVR